LRRIIQLLDDKDFFGDDPTLLRGIQNEAYEEGVEYGSFENLHRGWNWDWFIYASLQQRENIEVFHKLIVYRDGKCSSGFLFQAH